MLCTVHVQVSGKEVATFQVDASNVKFRTGEGEHGNTKIHGVYNQVILDLTGDPDSYKDIGITKVEDVEPTNDNTGFLRTGGEFDVKPNDAADRTATPVVSPDEEVKTQGDANKDSKSTKK